VASTPDDRITALALPQRGLLTVGQARAAGLTSAQICHRVDRGRLLRLGGIVLAIAGLELTWDRRVLAALLAGGPGAVVSHRAAACALGFDGFGEGLIEITVPRGRRLSVPPGTILHTALRLDPMGPERMLATLQKGVAHFVLRRFTEALVLLKEHGR
jgi:hypothetical protein